MNIVTLEGADDRLDQRIGVRLPTGVVRSPTPISRAKEQAFDKGLPRDLAYPLDALIEGTDRIVIRKTIGASSPFRVSLQVPSNGHWRTVRRRCSMPALPVR